ncbi:hypothetical protein, partial [Legionella oakridgensis]|uniref:hypothetical protein n=1 Tax=Legionella oakridgensis TaxID=29423 RepID=UPI001EE63D82
MSARGERLSRGKPGFVKRVPVLCSSLFTPAARSPGRMGGLRTWLGTVVSSREVEGICFTL